MAKPLIISLEYNHDCFCSDVPERYQDTSIRYIAELGLTNKSISHIFNIRGGEVNKFLDAIRKHPITYNLSVLRKTKDFAEIVAVSREDVSTRHAMNRSGCAFISYPIYDSGIEKAHMFAPSFEAFKHFLDSLKNSYNVKVTSKRYLGEDEGFDSESLMRSGYLDLFSAAGRLTRRQAEALRLASDLGYYEMPKLARLSHIAEKMGTSEAAAGELLRKAEKKLLPTLSRIVQLRS
jgi:predicted DNA binding protein